MGSDPAGSRSPRVGAPPAAPVRRAAIPPRPRARRITDQLDVLQEQIGRYRAQAVAVHAKLVELEASRGHDLATLRHTLIEISLQLERAVMSLMEPPEPARAIPA